MERIKMQKAFIEQQLQAIQLQAGGTQLSSKHSHGT